MSGGGRAATWAEPPVSPAQVPDPRAGAVREASYGVVALPLRRRLTHTSVDTGELEQVVLRLVLADGQEGWAETRGNGAYATHHTTRSIVAALAALPAVTRPAWRDPAALAASVARHCPPAAMLLDVAYRDAAARARGVTLASALRAGSGVPDRVDGPLPTHAAIPFGTPGEAAELTALAAGSGFRRVKIRVGGDPLQDSARIAAARTAADRTAGPGAVVLAADANGGWDQETALAATPWLARYGVAWLEQPTAPGDLTAMARVRAESPVPVWADEDVRDAADVRKVADLGAADGVHLKLEKAGTVAALAEAVAVARGRGLDVALGQMDCGRLGCATTAHLAAGLGLAVAELWGCANVDRDLAAGLDLREGAVSLPAAPGLGVEVLLDPALLTPVGRPGSPESVSVPLP
ncbi:chloromuconate cycloisomerase [Streptomyces griseoviridis]|uniref:Chloromuconate cycloisomerase n=2 Tax=Streptomyces TaxID=1883 RepID=A0A3Q9KS42_STRGD|nr:enolase C-terminal domain-like protein [Streptomyces sp. DSM 41014]AZS83069.1 chloromuconate cycloisomerase [Streptomyces griseoviridis]MDT0470573.1 enolase C-terminal domain-like protein [Streptomyces sp. DSM 41014]QCN90078.1 chloromuconate cycloisomerase [Streptomyces griseoviridis]